MTVHSWPALVSLVFVLGAPLVGLELKALRDKRKASAVAEREASEVREL